MKKALSYLTRRRLILLGIGFLAGVFMLTLTRAVTYSPQYVHYHGNFSLYVNGEREEFDSFTFYEEVQACGVGGADPKARVHMHNQENHLVHVHDEAATWGHFFANLGFGITPNAIETDRGVMTEENGNRLVFYLNGEVVDSIANRVIESEDVLLIDYGQSSEEEIRQRYASIPRDAGGANTKPDPATCSGSDEPSLLDRLKHAVGLPAQTSVGGHAHDTADHSH